MQLFACPLCAFSLKQTQDACAPWGYMSGGALEHLAEAMEVPWRSHTKGVAHLDAPLPQNTFPMPTNSWELHDPAAET